MSEGDSMKEVLLELCLFGVIACLLVALLTLRRLIPKKRR
jgi:hypothetical protein